jgi:PBP1b-binding outer membrane lipoprotein LpoB
MKRFYFLVILLLVFCLSSCVDIEEHYDFKADGSCSVVYDFDMSKAVSVLMNLMTDSVQSTPEFKMVKDTSLNFYSALPDSTIS